MLRHYGVKPILVFDGGLLPIKSDQETKRARYILYIHTPMVIATSAFQHMKFICNFTPKLWKCGSVKGLRLLFDILIYFLLF
jgi:hypothetical protein